MWQEIVQGFGGMVNALSTDTLTFKPCIPEQINEISFQVIWKGQRVAVTVSKGHIKVKNLSDKELTFNVYDDSVTVPAGKEISV